MEFKQLILFGTSWMLLLLTSRTLAEDPQSHTSLGMALQMSKSNQQTNNLVIVEHKKLLINERTLFLQAIISK